MSFLYNTVGEPHWAKADNAPFPAVMITESRYNSAPRPKACLSPNIFWHCRTPALASRVTQFTATEDELIIEQTESHGKMVNALVDDDPLALTPESLHVMHLRLNRFSGYIAISWQDHQVREVKPEGALRSVKKRYSNSKSFAADCSTMKQRIF